MNGLFDTWPWYVSGPLLAGIMFALLFLGKQFGFSANLRTLCTVGGAGKFSDFFKIDWRKQKWNLLFLIGSIIGGFFSYHFMSSQKVEINPQISLQLAEDYHIHSAGQAYLPTEIYDTAHLSDPKIILILLSAGFLVGFGARYAGGCTSGHAISGLSNLQVPSLIAVVGFFVGGLLMVHFLFPLIF